MKPSFKKITEWFILPLILLATLLSGLILLVSVPVVWETLYNLCMGDKLDPKVVSDAHSISRAFWNGQSYEAVNHSLHLPLLGAREIYHFEDVRDLIHFFFYPFSLGLLSLLVAKYAFKLRIRASFSLFYLLLLGGILTVWALLDWRHMFRSLHWWIFQDDSWILPKRCYTLQLFPYAVWQYAGAFVMGSLFLILTASSTIRYFLNKVMSKQSSENE